jgi:catechol 2,3-dioxygenase-like lactoylglutathione lyase family enzyme
VSQLGSDEGTLHHFGYVVRDIDRAIEQFTREGAMLEIAPTTDPIQGVTCALLRTAPGTAVELVAPIDPDDSPLASRLRRGGGLDHLCFSVPDVGLALERERALGGTVVCEPVHAVTFERTVGFVLRRSGLLVEFMGC